MALRLLAGSLLLGTAGCDGGEGPAARRCEEKVWYADADGDGWGDPWAWVEACRAPDGHVATSEDCDDTDALVHPFAHDVCEDTRDADCDGSEPVCQDHDVLEADGLLRGGSPDGDMAALEGGGLLVGAPGEGDAEGVAYVWSDRVQGERWLGDGATRTLYGRDRSAGFGSAVVGLGDGAVAVMGSDELQGTVVEVFGPQDAAASLRWQGEGERGPHRLDAGDLTGDGDVNLVIPWFHAEEACAVMVLDATGSGELGEGDEEARVDVEVWDDVSSTFAVEVAGDTDGDGFGDLLVASSRDFPVVFRGPVQGSLALGDADVVLEVGSHRSAVGDVDGDGRPDIGVSDATDGTHVLGLPRDGTYTLHDVTGTLACDSTYRCDGSLLGRFDVDADGRGDVAIQVEESDAHVRGLWLVHGPVRGSVEWPGGHALWTGELDTRDLAVTDLDGDALPEVAVALYHHDTAELGIHLLGDGGFR